MQILTINKQFIFFSVLSLLIFHPKMIATKVTENRVWTNLKFEAVEQNKSCALYIYKVQRNLTLTQTPFSTDINTKYTSRCVSSHDETIYCRFLPRRQLHMLLVRLLGLTSISANQITRFKFASYPKIVWMIIFNH